MSNKMSNKMREYYYKYKALKYYLKNKNNEIKNFNGGSMFRRNGRRPPPANSGEPNNYNQLDGYTFEQLRWNKKETDDDNNRTTVESHNLVEGEENQQQQNNEEDNNRTTVESYNQDDEESHSNTDDELK